MRDLEAHPFAQELPLIEGHEYEALVASIRQDGLINPIVLCEGKILDGRNRHRACLEAGVKPVFEIFEGGRDEQIAYVMAANLHRRHLTDQQRALIAARLSALQQVPISAAAQAMHVGERTAQKAAVVIRHGDENVVELVRRNEVSVDRAHKVVTGQLPKEDLMRDGRRGPGRPTGNHHVNALRRVLADVEPLYDYGDRIANHWPGDPDLNRNLARAAAFLSSLLQRTRESDHADAVA